jgi:hypothetical protein
MGMLLSRVTSPRLLFAAMVALGLAAQATLYLAAGGVALAILALMAWLFAFGGMAGGAMALLPTVASGATRGGAASGLINQFISLASFATPSVWLSLRQGRHFVLLAAVCLLLSLAALSGAVAAKRAP